MNKGSKQSPARQNAKHYDSFFEKWIPFAQIAVDNDVWDIHENATVTPFSFPTSYLSHQFLLALPYFLYWYRPPEVLLWEKIATPTKKNKYQQRYNSFQIHHSSILRLGRGRKAAEKHSKRRCHHYNHPHLYHQKSYPHQYQPKYHQYHQSIIHPHSYRPKCHLNQYQCHLNASGENI